MPQEKSRPTTAPSPASIEMLAGEYEGGGGSVVVASVSPSIAPPLQVLGLVSCFCEHGGEWEQLY